MNSTRIIPPDIWNPMCPVCGGELDIDDGNGLFECKCGWAERKSTKTVCGRCNCEVEKQEAQKNQGYCRDCFKLLQGEFTK